MKRLVIMFLLLTATAVAAADPTKMQGVWEGAGVQSDNNTTWSIRITIADGVSQIQYPSLNCGGAMRLLDVRGERLVFKEELSYGKDRCVNDGRIVLSKVGDKQAHFEWFYPDGKKGAVGTLVKRMPKGMQGTWDGAGVQGDNNSTWSIKIIVAETIHTIDYPSLHCGGKLRLLEDTANRMTFKEELQYGMDRCVNNGRVEITKAGENQARYEWYYPDGKMGAAGTLVRQNE